MSGRQFAIKKGIDEKNLRRWKQQVGKLINIRASNISVRKIRRIPRKKIGYFPAIDKAVSEWIIARNKKGLRVKDKFICMRGKIVRDELLETIEDEDEKQHIGSFKFSKSWCHRFKKRYQFVSHRHTTAHTLPVDFRTQAQEFIKKVQQICSENNIKREHIINFDQVPRYYESHMATTITSKGTREILLRKSSTTHKRFTFTPFVSAGGKILLKHCLFSKLKKEPLHHPQCRVSVNATGMWNKDQQDLFWLLWIATAYTLTFSRSIKKFIKPNTSSSFWFHHVSQDYCSHWTSRLTGLSNNILTTTQTNIRANLSAKIKTKPETEM